ncbi:KilA-N domain-containing protein [Metapseudomonas otitidis]
MVTTPRGAKSAGTWLHPKLAVALARWLDDEFAGSEI